MSYRTKSVIGWLIMFAVAMPVALLLIWLASFPDGRPNNALWRGEYVAPAMIFVAVVSSLARYAYIRTVRCPNCDVRFGFRNYMTGLLVHPWPRRRCWNCGVDMVEAEQSKRKRLK